MEIINVYNDIHLFGVHELDHIKITFEDNDFHIGDNIDMKGVDKRKVEDAENMMNYFKRKSKHYCSGNHELDTDKDTISERYKDVLFTHGDYLAWGDEKADAWREKTPGRGWKMRLGLRFIYPFRRFKKLKVSHAFKERCASKARDNRCHTVIMGHRHPTKVVETDHMGIKILILPRGKNTLSIDGETVTYINGEK